MGTTVDYEARFKRECSKASLTPVIVRDDGISGIAIGKRGKAFVWWEDGFLDVPLSHTLQTYRGCLMADSASVFEAGFSRWAMLVGTALWKAEGQ